MEESATPDELHQEEKRNTEQTELRLVLLGSSDSGKSSVVDVIVGVPRCESERETPDSDGQKRRGTLAGRAVCVIETPARLCVERGAQDVRRQFSLCASLSAPGPHAFLLCVPVHRPTNLELQMLESLEKVFGREAVSGHTLVLLTGTEQMPEVADVPLEELLSERADLLELVQRCGERIHALRPELELSLQELREKLELEDGGTHYYTCPVLQEAERRVCLRAEQLRSNVGTDEEARAEAERSVDDLPLEGINDLCLAPDSSLLRQLWDTALSWILWLPNMVRGSTLLGSILGMFVGGSLGGAMGATVGSVATEVGRRKHKTK